MQLLVKISQSCRVAKSRFPRIVATSERIEIRAPRHEASIDLSQDTATRLRFEAYIDALIGVISHADRAVPLHDYCTGLLLPGERKSVEPMAALTAPARTAPQHQSLLHFAANAPWSDEAVLSKVRQIVLPEIEARSPIEAVPERQIENSNLSSVPAGRKRATNAPDRAP